MLLPLDHRNPTEHNRPTSCTQGGGFDSPMYRRTNRHHGGIFMFVNTATFSMGATCGKPSGLPEPVPGLSTRTFAPTPFDSGRRDSKRYRSRTMKTRTPSAPRFFRFPLYRLARHFTGPILAFRIARLGQ